MNTLLGLVTFLGVNYMIYLETGPWTAGMFFLFFIMFGRVYTKQQYIEQLYKKNLSSNQEF